MREVMTKSMARNIFYGGSLFFIIIFVGLTAQSHRYITTTSTDAAGLTDSVAAGKHIWEKHACINCHTILGEGAYFAPELGNVMTRWGVADDPEAASDAVRHLLADGALARQLGAAGRARVERRFTWDRVVRDLRALAEEHGRP